MKKNYSVFIDNEKEYLKWLKQNPKGYVVNTYRNPNASYMPLHTACCHTIQTPKNSARKDAFTSHGYIKACSNDPKALLEWMTGYGATFFSRLCSKCNPILSDSMDDAEMHHKQLEAEVQKLQKNPRQLQAKIANLPRTPPSYSYKSIKVYDRNPAVIAAVRQRANGTCERCHKPAPFRRANDNEPFLEVHHKVFLSNGGIDHPDNAIALCPNCHRELHFGSTATD